jgi:hypothetical protein
MSLYIFSKIFTDIYDRIWEIFTEAEPWIKYNSAEEISAAVNRGERLDISPDFIVKDVVSAGWNQDPDLRPPMDDMLALILTLNQKPGVKTQLEEYLDMLKVYLQEISMKFDI